METFVNQAVDNTEKNTQLLNPPNVDKPLEKLYKTIKRLQAYCITINTIPNMSWKNFMEVYRLSLDAPQDENVKKLLSEKNQQLQLREYTGKYLDNISPMMLQIFEEIQNFSLTFSSCYEDFHRGIRERAEGSTDQDYVVVIDYLLEEIKKSQDKNKDRDEALTSFSKELNVNYNALNLLKTHAETFFDENIEKIKRIEKELSILEATEDKYTKKDVEISYQNKAAIKFLIIIPSKNLAKSKVSDKNKKSDESDEVENNKKKLNEKINKLKQELANYDSDYANLILILKTCCQFRSGLFSLRKDVMQIKQTWNNLAEFLTYIAKTLQDEGTEKEWIINSLITRLNLLADYFEALDKTVNDVKKILPMEIAIVEEDEEDLVTLTSAKVPNSRLLNYHIKKNSSQ